MRLRWSDPLNPGVLMRFAVVRTFCWVLLATLLPAGPTVAASEAVVQVTRINLRFAPDRTSRVLAVLEKDTRVAVLAREDGWVKVRYEGGVGYLRDRERYVRVEEVAPPRMEKAQPRAEDTVRRIVRREADAGKSIGQEHKDAKAQPRVEERGRRIACSEAVVRKMIDDGRKCAGVVYPLCDISLSMGVGGVVSSLKIELGDAVERGQLLLQLDDAAEKIEAQRRRVIWDNRAELQSLEKRLGRMRTLLDDVRSLFKESGSVSRDEVFQTELEFFTLQGRHEKLEADKERERFEYLAADQDLEMRRLHAPISGFITHLEVDVGEWVSPGKVVARLVDTSSGILRLAVPEPVARHLRSGAVVPIRFEEYPGVTRCLGEVTFVSAAADPASGLIQVEITFDNRGLGIRPGGKAYAFLPSPRSRE